MKKIITLLLVPFFLLTVSSNVFGVNTPETKKMQAEVLGMDLFAKLDLHTIDDFLALTPRKIKKATGKRLKLSQVIGLKVVQKKLKKKINANPTAFAPASGGRSQLVALLLVIFLGYLGIHRFYLGYTTYGIIQLLTAGGCGIWALIDLIRIATGDLEPADGPYEETI